MPAPRPVPSHQRRDNNNNNGHAFARLSSSTSSSRSQTPSPPSASRAAVRSSRDSAAGRLSGSISRPSTASPPRGFWRAKWAEYLRWSDGMTTAFWKLSPLHRLAAVLLGLLGATFVVVSVLYTEAFFAWLATVSKSWRRLPGGWLISFFLVFATSFPPVVGYSTACTVAGFVYGFPLGWPIAASACVVGSLVAFVACRTVLSRHVQLLIGGDHRFVALGQVLRQDGLLYLTGIRFCPLPFSLSNGFLATIPSISPLSFALSTALSTPKLIIHIFIGSRLALLAEHGDDMPIRDKVLNYTSMLIGGAIGAAAGIIIYRRTMARATELAREEALQNAEEGDGGYEDTDDTLMDPDDAADVMGDDDVSLWETQGDDGWGDGDDDDNGHDNAK